MFKSTNRSEMNVFLLNKSPENLSKNMLTLTEKNL